MAACAAATTFTVATPSTAGGSVTTAKDDCVTAWAILAPGDAASREAVQGVVRWHPHWKSDVYERGHSQSFQLQVFDLTFAKGGSATVAHCGHGATCNELAREVLKAYPNIGNPVVYCTMEAPHILENPQGI